MGTVKQERGAKVRTKGLLFAIPVLFVVTLLVAVVVVMPSNAWASTWSGKTTVDWFDDEKTFEKVGTYDGEGIYAITASAEVSKKDKCHGTKKVVARLGIQDEYGDHVRSKDVKATGTTTWWVDGTDMEEGQRYKLTVRWKDCGSFEKVKVKWSIRYYDGYMTSMYLPKSLSIHAGRSGVVKHYSTNKNRYLEEGYVKWASSDKSVATVSKGGRLATKKKGQATVTATLDNGKKYSCLLTVTDPKPWLNYTTAWAYRGERFKLKLNDANGKVKWSSTKKSIATVSKGGTVHPKKLGTCYVKAKCKGKTYKCKVRVYRLQPNFGAYVYAYQTRANVFKVKVRNKGAKTLTFKSGTGKVEDAAYKGYDRKVRLAKTVKVKSNQTKTLIFKVQGRTTRHDYRAFTLKYRCTYDGKTYKTNVWDTESVYNKKGGSWHDTFWDYDWYEGWNKNL